MPKVKLYYDIVSPWAYMAYNILKRYEKTWSLDLQLCPVYLGGVMVASGNKPPITVKNKGLWMNQSDLPLVSEYNQLPIKFPDSFPVQTMSIMRLLRVIKDKAPNKLRPATDIFYGAVWAGDSKANLGATASAKPENFRQILPKELFSDDELKALVEASMSQENKDRIKAEAAKVVEEEGAFGFPWMMVTNDKGETRPFFGADRFEVMAYHLGLKWDGPKPGGQNAKL